LKQGNELKFLAEEKGIILDMGRSYSKTGQIIMLCWENIIRP